MTGDQVGADFPMTSLIPSPPSLAAEEVRRNLRAAFVAVAAAVKDAGEFGTTISSVSYYAQLPESVVTDVVLELVATSRADSVHRRAPNGPDLVFYVWTGEE